MTFKFIDPDWTLTRAELHFLQKYRGKNKFQGALFLKHYQKHACFPGCSDDLEFSAIRSVTEQLDCDDSVHDLDFQYRTAKRQRVDIRDYLGFRLPNADDYSDVQSWLCAEIIEEPEQTEGLCDYITQWCLNQKIEKPSVQKQERITKGALAAFEADIFRRVKSRLSSDCLAAVDALFSEDNKADGDDTPFSVLKIEPGRPSLKSIMNELLKLESIDMLGLPDDLFREINDRTVSKYRRRASVETAWEMRRHPDGVRYTLACAFLLLRRSEIIDGLIELLIQLIHKIKIRSEKRVTKEIAGNVREVSNKKMTLFKLAQAALDNPEGSVRDVLFPAVGQNVLEDLVKEFQAERPIYKEKLQVYIRNSYKNHYRQMAPPILQSLSFRCRGKVSVAVKWGQTYVCLK